MGKHTKQVVDEYIAAVDERDYATQSGILLALLRLIVHHGESVPGEIARSTAKTILMYRQVEGK